MLRLRLIGRLSAWGFFRSPGSSILSSDLGDIEIHSNFPHKSHGSVRLAERYAAESEIRPANVT